MRNRRKGRYWEGNLRGKTGLFAVGKDEDEEIRLSEIEAWV